MLGLIMALLSAFAILAISRMPSRFLFAVLLFAVLFGALTFLIFALLQNNVERLVSKPFNLSLRFRFKYSREFYVLLIYAISIFLVLLIPSFSEAQFVNWQSIPAANYIRLLAGLLLSSIFPGYGLLRLIDRKRRFDGLASIVFSFFISVFMMALITFATFAANLPISNIFWLSLILNLVILVGYSFTFVKKNKPAMDQENDLRVSHRIDYLIIACIFLFFVIGWIVYYSSYQLGSTGDMWDHYYTVLHISKGGLFSSSHLSYLNVETWFSLHYIATFELTGFPSLNGWMVYAFINLFYILAFYLMVKGIVGDKYPKIPIIATVIATLFAGFGWIEALSLASTNSWLSALNTGGNYTFNDIIYSFIYGPIPQYFSLAVLFALLYLMTNKGKFSLTNTFLTVVLIVQGLLVHSPEIIFFAIFYFCFLIFCNREDFGRLKKYSLSILLGFFAVFLIGLPFASHFYFNMSSILPILFIVFILSFVVIYIRTRKTINFNLTIPKIIPILFIGAVWVFYFLSFFVWNATLDSHIVGNLGVVGLKPWYIYPISSGISLLLGLLGITYLIIDKNTKLLNAKFLALSLCLFFVAGILLSFVNTYFNIANIASTYWEKRLYSFMIIPLSLFGAFFLTQVSSKLRYSNPAKKLRPVVMNLLVGLLIVVVLVSGVSSNVLALDRTILVSNTPVVIDGVAYMGDPYANFSKAEFQALDFLRTNASADATVLGLSDVSNRFAYVFSGMNHLTSTWFIGNSSFQFIDITNPELALKILYSTNTAYLFATNSDLETMKSNNYFVSHLLKFLPVAFKNSEVTIYQVPKLNPPSSESNLTLAVPVSSFNALANSDNPAPSDSTFYFPIDMLAESGLDYSIRIAEDGSSFDSKYLVLPSDKGWTNEQITQYLEWINKGGKLIVLNGDGLGDFARILSISSNSTDLNFVNNANSSSATFDLGSFTAISLFSSDDQVKIVANYTSENNISMPLAFSKKIGNGEILYLNVDPLFGNLYSTNDTLPINFLKVGNLIGLLSLDVSVFKDVPTDRRWEYLGYDSTWIRDHGVHVQLEGAVNIESNSTFLPSDKINASRLSLENITGTVNGLAINEPISLPNVVISGLFEKGAVHSVLESQNVSIIPTDYGSYSCLLSDTSYSVLMQVPQKGITFSALSIGNGTYKIDLQSGTMTLENISSPLTFFTRAPLVTVNLTPKFSNITASFPDAYVPNYINNVVGGSFNITDTAHFSFDSSSDSVIVLTDFGYSGKPQTGQQPIVMIDWEIPKISWENVLPFPLFLITTAFLLILSIAFIRHRKKNKNY
jgi:hypothetical protein